MDIVEWFMDIVECRTLTCKYVISRFGGERNICKLCNCYRCCVKVSEVETKIIERGVDRFVTANRMRVL